MQPVPWRQLEVEITAIGYLSLPLAVEAPTERPQAYLAPDARPQCAELESSTKMGPNPGSRHLRLRQVPAVARPGSVDLACAHSATRPTGP